MSAPNQAMDNECECSICRRSVEKPTRAPNGKPVCKTCSEIPVGPTSNGGANGRTNGRGTRRESSLEVVEEPSEEVQSFRVEFKGYHNLASRLTKVEDDLKDRVADAKQQHVEIAQNGLKRHNSLVTYVKKVESEALRLKGQIELLERGGNALSENFRTLRVFVLLFAGYELLRSVGYLFPTNVDALVWQEIFRRIGKVEKLVLERTKFEQPTLDKLKYVENLVMERMKFEQPTLDKIKRVEHLVRERMSFEKPTLEKIKRLDQLVVDRMNFERPVLDRLHHIEGRLAYAVKTLAQTEKERVVIFLMFLIAVGGFTVLLWQFLVVVTASIKKKWNRWHYGW